VQSQEISYTSRLENDNERNHNNNKA